ncbi:FAD-dependent oxidoreductase [Arthrobacter castelli]|uniref:FAD-dependent oxidoreductase n=1 Tax=Arthrobacter castelli TaxID=271431 RepID=UPI0003FC9552|nr:FAD-dependent oxidoreductase [Arthrobacter castelli]
MTGSADTALVVGGGVAGLAAAASMLQQGWSVTVLEQAPEFTEVGAGLALTANGLSALAGLGLGDTARATGHRLHMAGTMNERGDWLMRIP